MFGKALANRNREKSSGTFTLEVISLGKKRGNDFIALKSVYGKYLVVEKLSNDINANRLKRGAWELFQVEKQKDGTIALRTAHDLYVGAEKDGSLRADSTKIGNSEKFTVKCKGRLVSGINYYIMFTRRSITIYQYLRLK